MMTRDLDLRMLNALATDLRNKICDYDSLIENQDDSIDQSSIKLKRKIARSKFSDLDSRIAIEKKRLHQKSMVELATHQAGFMPCERVQDDTKVNGSASANIEIIEQARALQYRKLKAGMIRQAKVIAQIKARLQTDLELDDELINRYAAFVIKTDGYISNLFRSIKAKRSMLVELYHLLPEFEVYQEARNHLGRLGSDKAMAAVRHQSTFLRRTKSKAGL